MLDRLPFCKQKFGTLLDFGLLACKMVDKMDEYLVCDVCFNEQIIEDIKLLKTCNLGKIIQGLWEDEKFYNAALSFLNSKDEKQDDSKTDDKEWALKSIHGLDRSILRAYGMC